jgi:hypothetical protein
MGKISQLLAPQLNAISKRAGTAKKTLAEFGNRGGGTNAKTQSIGDTTRAETNDLVAGLTSSAASNLGSLGMGLLSAGMSGETSLFNEANVMHDQSQAKWNDIFNSIANVAGVFAGIPGMPAGASTALKGAAGVLQPPTEGGSYSGSGTFDQFPWQIFLSPGNVGAGSSASGIPGADSNIGPDPYFVARGLVGI